MSSISLPCLDGLPNLLLVEPPMGNSLRAAQLSYERFCVTQTDSAPNVFLLRHAVRFTIAVLSDQLGTPSLCAAAQSVRWQWPFARILILGRVPAAMNDQLYDEVADHSVDGDTLRSKIDKLTEDPTEQTSGPLQTFPQGPPARAPELRESDPRKRVASVPQEDHKRDQPSDRYGSQHGV